MAALLASTAFERATLDCDRATDLCLIRERGKLFERSGWSLAVSNLAGAEIELPTGTGDHRPRIRITKHEGYSSALSSWQDAPMYGGLQRIDIESVQASVDAINRFAKDSSQRTLHVEQHGRGALSLFGAAVLALFFALVAYANAAPVEREG